MRIDSPEVTRGAGPDGARTTRLMLYIMLSIVLMAMDQRGHYVPRVRAALEHAVEPIYHLVELPVQGLRGLRTWMRGHAALLDENQALQEALGAQAARVQRMQALEDENRRLRALLDAVEGQAFGFRFAEMVQVNLDPFAHIVLIDHGSADGVFEGQAVLDGAGVMGQVEAIHLHTARVRLISDPDHALPVQILRTGQRTVAFGTGQAGRLHLPNLPIQADIRPGDVLVTSGLGDRFPAGFPVAEVTTIDRDTGEPFADVAARPLAALDRGREVLLVVPAGDGDDGP